MGSWIIWLWYNNKVWFSEAKLCKDNPIIWSQDGKCEGPRGKSLKIKSQE
jgi:hypothetical protein